MRMTITAIGFLMLFSCVSNSISSSSDENTLKDEKNLGEEFNEIINVLHDSETIRSVLLDPTIEIYKNETIFTSEFPITKHISHLQKEDEELYRLAMKIIYETNYDTNTFSKIFLNESFVSKNINQILRYGGLRTKNNKAVVVCSFISNSNLDFKGGGWAILFLLEKVDCWTIKNEIKLFDV